MEKEIKIFNKIVKDISTLNKDEQFDTMFILTCMLVYRLSVNGEQLDLILRLLNEFDYNENFK